MTKTNRPSTQEDLCLIRLPSLKQPTMPITVSKSLNPCLKGNRSKWVKCECQLYVHVREKEGNALILSTSGIIFNSDFQSHNSGCYGSYKRQDGRNATFQNVILNVDKFNVILFERACELRTKEVKILNSMDLTLFLIISFHLWLCIRLSEQCNVCYLY